MGFTIVVKTTLSEAMAKCCKQQTSPASPRKRAYKTGVMRACHIGSHSGSQCNSHLLSSGLEVLPILFISQGGRRQVIFLSLPCWGPQWLLDVFEEQRCRKWSGNCKAAEAVDDKRSFFPHFLRRPFTPVWKGATDVNCDVRGGRSALKEPPPLFTWHLWASLSLVSLQDLYQHLSHATGSHGSSGFEWLPRIARAWLYGKQAF